MRPRTASAAWRSERPSTYWSTETRASRAGEAAGCPRGGTGRRTGRRGRGVRVHRRYKGRGCPWERRREPHAGSLRGSRGPVGDGVTLVVLAGKDSQVGSPGLFSACPGSSHNYKAGRKMEFATSVTVGSTPPWARRGCPEDD